MAEYQITYWRNIPSMVTAREGRRHKAKTELSRRFQVAIDEAAMRAELVGTDAYLEEWRRDAWQKKEGTPEDVSEAVAAELEVEYTPARLRELMQSGGK